MKGYNFFTGMLGAGSGVFLPDLLSNSAILSLALSAAFLFYWPWFKPIAFFILGLLFASIQLAQVIDKQLPLNLAGKDLQLDVQIIGLPESNGESTRFLARVIELEGRSHTWRENIRLSWFRAPTLAPGEFWRLKVRLKRPRGWVNHKGFDYQAWLLSRKIYATGYVRKGESEKLLQIQPDANLPLLFSRLRFLLKEKLYSANSLPMEALSRALLLGDKSLITKQQWNTLQATGTIHLMAISGLHVGLIASMGFFIGRFISRLLSCFIVSRYGHWLLAPILSILFSFLYAGLAGFSIPTRRAFVFICLINCAVIWGRKVNYFYLLSICSLLIVLLDPFAFLAPGFYLSFLAVAVLFYCFLGRSGGGKRSWIKQSIASQVVVFIGLFLPLVLLQLPLSPLGFFANLVAIPLVAFAIVPLLFVGLLGSFISIDLAVVFISMADGALLFLWKFLELVESSGFSSVHITLSGPISIASALLAVVFILSPGALNFRIMGFMFLCLILLPVKNKTEGLRVSILDVGQGLSVFVDSPHLNLLYDTGAYYSENFDMGSRIITPYLQSRRVDKLDYLIVSHGDNDHAGGMLSILNKVKVKYLLLGKGVDSTRSKGEDLGHREIDNGKIEMEEASCFQGLLYRDAFLEVNVLWPPKPGSELDNKISAEVRASISDKNNQSCVLLIQYAGLKFLLAGDIEEEVERFLLEEERLPEHIDVLVAPHHGSKTSSSKGFIQTLRPRVVVISSGYGNRYRHPHKPVLQTYASVGAQVFRTDLDGAIEINGRLACPKGGVPGAMTPFLTRIIRGQGKPLKQPNTENVCLQVTAERKRHRRAWYW